MARNRRKQCLRCSISLKHSALQVIAKQWNSHQGKPHWVSNPNVWAAAILITIWETAFAVTEVCAAFRVPLSIACSIFEFVGSSISVQLAKYFRSWNDRVHLRTSKENRQNINITMAGNRREKCIRWCVSFKHSSISYSYERSQRDEVINPRQQVKLIEFHAQTCRQHEYFITKGKRRFARMEACKAIRRVLSVACTDFFIGWCVYTCVTCKMYSLLERLCTFLKRLDKYHGRGGQLSRPMLLRRYCCQARRFTSYL